MEKTRARFNKFFINGAGPTLFLAAGLTTYILSGQPFGTVFNTCLYLALAGLILTLLVPGIGLIKASRRWMRPFGVFLIFVSLVLLTGIAAVSIDYTILPFFDVRRGLTKDQWREDLAFLAREMPLRHPGLFELIPEDSFNLAVSDLENRINGLDETTIEAELAKIVALAGDAHSYPNIFSYNLDWHMYPLEVYWFDDGIYVTNAAREHGDLISTRVVEICGTPVEKVLEAVEPYLPAENEYGTRSRNTGTITLAEWLYASGVSKDAASAVFTLEKENGERLSVRLKPEHYLPVCYWSFVRRVDNVSCPAVPNPRRDNYTFEYKEDSKTLYFQFNQVVEQENGERLAEFTDRLAGFVDQHDLERFVVDVRNNDGGNGSLVPPLVDFIAGNEKINRAGKLFVVIGRKTFSAAVMFAAMMGNNTKAIFVGEPTSQGPIFYSNPDVLTLPNSAMQFTVSRHLTMGSLEFDKRDRISPDIRTRYTWADHKAGRDPAMEAILSYEHERPRQIVVDEGTLDRYRGRYLLTPYQVLTVEKAGGRLRAKVSDFIEGSFQVLQTDMYPVSPAVFLTDIAGVKIMFPHSDNSNNDAAAERLSFVWGDTVLDIDRAPAGHKLPMELIQMGRIEEGAEALLREKDLYKNHVRGLESVLNAAGYLYLREEKFKEAIKIFQVNTEFFPQSANTWDSLGEGYMKAGQTELSIENYQKSLDLNPDNENAKKMLKRLRG